MSLRESIYIKNVGPIRELRIDNIRPLTILIGASATGKSTLMKVLALMRYIYKMENIRSYLLNSEIKRSPFRLEFKNLLKDGLGTAFSKSSVVEYTADVEGKQYTISYQGGNLQNKIRIADEHLLFYKEAYIVEERASIASFLSGRAAGRNDLGFYFNDTLSNLQNALNIRSSLTLEHLGFELSTRKGGNNQKRYLISGASNRDIPEVELKYASSGIQTSTPLISLLLYFAQDFSFEEALRRSILAYLFDSNRLTSFRPTTELSQLPRHVHLYIEEPELNLYPRAQYSLFDVITKEAFLDKKKDRKLSLMIATHSPYIASYINVLLRKSRQRDSEIGLHEEDFDIYLLEDGIARCLVGEDEETGERVVDTYPLMEPMDEICDTYIALEEDYEQIPR